jgi:hypothetical protein
VYKKKYKHLQYKMNIIRIIIKNTSILYVFDIIKLDSFSNILEQTLSNLALTNPECKVKKDRGSIRKHPLITKIL